METFIEYKGMHLTRYEWSYGDTPSVKVLSERKKLADKKKIRVIYDEKDF